MHTIPAQKKLSWQSGLEAGADPPMARMIHQSLLLRSLYPGANAPMSWKHPAATVMSEGLK